MPERTRHTLALQLTGQVREDTFEGRPHLVAPVTAVREMVLGGNGGELLPAEEIRASADLWEGRPLTIGHPPQNANLRHVLEAHSVGKLFNVTANGDLRGELWVDLTRAPEVDGGAEAVRLLQEGGENGTPTLEVSTAYLAALERKSGRHDGTLFRGVQRGIIPEHLALLPGERGKCSIDDGCGAPRANALSSAREPTFDGTSSAEWSAPTLSDYVSALGFEEIESVADLSQAQAQQIAVHTLLGDPAAESFDDLSFFPVVEPESGDLNENALRAVISGRGAQADIPASALASARGIARTLLEEEFDVEVEEEENVDERSTLRKGLDAIAQAFEGLAGRVENEDDVEPEPLEKETTMNTREQIVTALAECEECPFDEERLNAMGGEALFALAQTRKLNLDEGVTAEALEEDEKPGAEDEEEKDEEDSVEVETAHVELSAEDASYVRELREAGAEPKAVAQAVQRMNAEAEAEASERADLIERIQNAGDCEFSGDELKGLRTETLQKLAEPEPRRNYLGRGGARGGEDTESYVDRQPNTPRMSQLIRKNRGLD